MEGEAGPKLRIPDPIRQRIRSKIAANSIAIQREIFQGIKFELQSLANQAAQTAATGKSRWRQSYFLSKKVKNLSKLPPDAARAY